MTLSCRLKEKIKHACHKNILPLVLTDWLLNGSVKDKEDVYSIVDNLDDTLMILNGIYGQIHQTITSEQIKSDLYFGLKKILCQQDKYGNLETRNIIYIETRGWILPIISKCCCDDNVLECTALLEKFMSQQVDIRTQFWSFKSYTTNIKKLENEKIKSKIDDVYSKTNQLKNRLYWGCHLWYLNNKIDGHNSGEILELLENCTNKNHLIEFFISLSFSTCTKITKALTKFIEKKVIEKDLISLWDESDIQLYKYIITSLMKYGYHKYKNEIKEDQENICHLLFRMLSITRTYSSRIWTEISLQLLKSLRIYYKTTNKKIIDNLSHEILQENLNLTKDACKTLNCIYGSKDSTKIIIDILLNEQNKCTNISQSLIVSVSLGLKFIVLNDNNIFDILDDIICNSTDYNEKNIVRMLLTEMGGFTAINKLKENRDMREKYMEMTSKAQDKVEIMFQKSILDAKKGFKISLYMNIATFILGFSLLAVSGFVAVFNDNEENWAGIGLSTGTGFLSIIYSLFLNKPSRKIRKSTNHLMRLKVIFLGYLRELTQMDQTFSKHLLDTEPISQNDLKSYLNKITYSMNNALNALRWEETNIDMPNGPDLLNEVVV